MLTLLREIELAENGWYRNEKGTRYRYEEGARQSVFERRGEWWLCIAYPRKLPVYHGPFRNESKAIRTADLLAK